MNLTRRGGIQELPAPMHASRACREHTQMRLVLKWGQISFKSRHVLCVPLLYPICGCGAFYDYKLATNTSKCVNLYPCLAYRVRQLVEPMIVFLNIKLMVSTFYIWSKLSSSRAILFRLLWLLSMSSWVLL